MKLLDSRFSLLAGGWLDGLRHSSVLVTGATGFLGSLTVRFLLYLNKTEGMDIQITAWVRSKSLAEEMYAGKKVRIAAGDLARACSADFADIDPDYIFHFASVTQSREMVSRPVEAADGIVNGTQRILELSGQRKIKGMVYVSSMEVYGSLPESVDGVTEERLGELDLFSVRSCYPMGKRMAEHYCFLYAREYGVPVKIARLAQVFGVGVLPGENRVFAQFARAAVEGRDIVLHTDGSTVGNYCESLDAVRALLTILLVGRTGETYNVVNEENTMRIREMAELVAEKIAGGTIRVRYEIDAENTHGYAAAAGNRLSGAKLRTLGWKPVCDLETMYREMIEWIL